MHPIIKFTAEYSENSIQFLDVAVDIENFVLKTDVFVRPTDRQQCLESSSCHSFHCKKGIPYSQVLRLSRMCSDNFFKQEMQ